MWMPPGLPSFPNLLLAQGPRSCQAPCPRVVGPVPPARPWLAVLASLVGCDDLFFLCLSRRVHLLPAPIPGSPGPKCLCVHSPIFSDSFLFSAQLSSSRGPPPEAQGVPALPCRQHWGICVADTCTERQAWPPRPPSPSRGLLGRGWLTAV